MTVNTDSNFEVLPKVLLHSCLISSFQRHIIKEIDQSIINQTLTKHLGRIFLVMILVYSSDDTVSTAEDITVINSACSFLKYRNS